MAESVSDDPRETGERKPGSGEVMRGGNEERGAKRLTLYSPEVMMGGNGWRTVWEDERREEGGKEGDVVGRKEGETTAALLMKTRRRNGEATNAAFVGSELVGGESSSSRPLPSSLVPHSPVFFHFEREWAGRDTEIIQRSPQSEKKGKSRETNDTRRTRGDGEWLIGPEVASQQYHSK